MKADTNKKTIEQQKLNELVKGMWLSMVIGVILGLFAGIILYTGIAKEENGAEKYIYLGVGIGLAVIIPLLWRHALKKVMKKYKTVDEMFKNRSLRHINR